MAAIAWTLSAHVGRLDLAVQVMWTARLLTNICHLGCLVQIGIDLLRN
ncbi:hypothetical protein [Mesorhizobium tamadayense]|nr:hypothetical protein [Mesorhizobium tamadayense]